MADTEPFSITRFPTRNAVNNLELYAKGAANLPRVMSQLGYDQLRKGQDQVVASIMCQRDTMCVLPTGHGKSATFIVPTMALGWRTLVFSPLVALMRDQVKKLWKMGVTEAAQMSSTQSEGENTEAARRWMSGQLQFLYVAPERLRNSWFQTALRAIRPNMIVVDEAHTLSNWSDNFRPEYCKIGDYIRDHPPEVVLTLTATFPEEVELDVKRVLGLSNAVRCVYYPRRKNLHLSSGDYTSDYDIVEFLNKLDGGQAIVYCSSIRGVEELTRFLNMNMNEEVGFFHGQLSPANKRTAMDLFMDGHQRVMVATNAFGMGVDKPNIRGVIHRNIPGSLEALAQEVGRAGRDGLDSFCRTLYDDRSKGTQEFFIMCAYPGESDVRKVYAALQRLTGASGTLKLTNEELAKAANVHEAVINGVLQTLRSAAVIERSSAKSDIAKVKILGNAPPSDTRWHELRGLIEQLGVEGEFSMTEISVEALVERMGVQRPTVMNYFKKYSAMGFLHYEPPFRGSETTILGGIERVEFARLAAKQANSYEKLKKVLEYCNVVPDNQKHAFLEEYFGIAYDE